MSSSSETLCLRWNDFESGIKQGFSQLRSDEDFHDVTLSCGGGNQIKAHKVILATYSPFFKSLLRSLPHHHPLLYLRGIHFNHLESVLGFMYHGEVRVKPEDLDEFLTVAQDLQVNGLVSTPANVRSEARGPSAPRKKEEPNYMHEGADDDVQEIMQLKTEEGYEGPTAKANQGRTAINNGQASSNMHSRNPVEVPLPEDQFKQEASDEEMIHEDREDTLKKTNELLDAEINKFIVPLKDTKQFKCSKCHYTTSFKTTIKRHIEAKHFITDGFPCDKCDSRFKTRGSLNTHKSRKHKREPEFFATDYL